MSKIEFNFKDKNIDTMISILGMLKGEYEKESICIFRKDKMDFIGVDAEVNFSKMSNEPKINSMLKVSVLYSDIFQESEIADYESPIYIPISTFLDKFKNNLSVIKDNGGGDTTFIITYDEFKEYSITKSKLYIDMLTSESPGVNEVDFIYVATKIVLTSKKIDVNLDILSITNVTSTLTLSDDKFKKFYKKDLYTCTAKFPIGVDDVKSINNLIKNTNSKMNVRDGYVTVSYNPDKPNTISISNSYFSYYLDIDYDMEDVDIYLKDEFEYNIDSKVINKIQGEMYTMEFYDNNNSIDTALIAKSMVYDSIYISPTKISI